MYIFGINSSGTPINQTRVLESLPKGILKTDLAFTAVFCFAFSFPKGGYWRDGGEEIKQWMEGRQAGTGGVKR